MYKTCIIALGLTATAVASDVALVEIVSVDAPPWSKTATYSVQFGKQVVAKGTRLGFLPPYTYSLNDVTGKPIVNGYTSLLFPGYWTTISVYDPDDSYLGCISCTMWTHARAKYALYDRVGNCFASAYLDADVFRFLIMRGDTTDILMELKGTTVGTMGQLEVVKHFGKDETFDSRILDIFKLFLLDYRYKFGIQHPQPQPRPAN